MYAQALEVTAKAMVTPGKGILAADESYGTANKRFEALGIPTTEAMRRDYREMLFTTPGLGDFISGVILFDETIRQSTAAGVPFCQVLEKAGVIPGIKLDLGAKPLAAAPGETVTEGLDELRDRITEYYKMGARFAKWRAVLKISPTLPSARCIETNAHALARYAALCQEGGLVPIVEPEVLMDGDHTLERSLEVHQQVLVSVFSQLYLQGVELTQMILKPSMVIPGSEALQSQVSVEQVADVTVGCLLRTVPAAVPGCAFLSGGQTDTQATAHLNAMNARFQGQLPWQLTFSYGRALQQPALKAWLGQASNVEVAQKLFYHRARCNGAASLGQYQSVMESIEGV
jgi:fructose-bisphosphate aldolase, class I